MALKRRAMTCRVGSGSISLLAVLFISVSASAKPSVLVLPYQGLSDRVPAETAEQTTSLIAREIKAQGLAIASPDEKSGASKKEGQPRGGGEASDADAERKARRLVAGAKKKLEETELKAAIEDLKKAARLLEENAASVSDLGLLSEVYLLLGVAYFRDDQEEDADEQLTKAVHLDPERTLSAAAYPPVFIRVYDRARFNVLRRPRGDIEVRAKAGAQVSLDGRSLGRAPLLLKNALPGKHWVRVERPGEEPEVKAIQLRSKTTLNVEFQGTKSETDAQAGVLAVIAGNRLDKRHLDQIAAAGRKASASLVLFGAIYRTNTAYQIRSALLDSKSGQVTRLVDIAFDLDLLSAEIEVFKLAEDAAKEAKKMSRVLTTDRLVLAPDFTERQVIAQSEQTKSTTVIAAPAPMQMPKALAAVPSAPPAPRDENRVATPASRAVPKDEAKANTVVASSKESGEPSDPESAEATASSRLAAVTPLDDGQAKRSQADEGEPWWLWVVVGVAAAGAAAGGGYLLFANRTPEEGNLRISWP